MNDADITHDLKIQKNNTFEWHILDDRTVIQENNLISLKNEDNKSLYVDFLLLVPLNEYKSAREKFDESIKTKNIINLTSDLQTAQIQTDAKSLTLLPLSYSPYWMMCNIRPLRVDFYGMGFNCQAHDDKNPIFVPDTLYKSSLALMVGFHLALIILASYLLFYRPKKS